MNKFYLFFQKLNNSPIWNHAGLFFFVFIVITLITMTSLIVSIEKWGEIKPGFFIVFGAIHSAIFISFLLLAVRNYYINKKIGIWNHYKKKTKNGRLID